MGQIYKITNTINLKIYIGSAVNFDKRRWLHLHNLRKGKHHSPILQASWNKYGEEVFIFEILEQVSENTQLIVREQEWIDTLKPEFNCSPTAGSPLGVKHTLQARMNMSIAHLGKKLTAESIRKRTLAITGIKRSAETIERMRNTAHNKAIIQEDLHGNFIREWKSAAEAERNLHVSAGHISSCCKGKRKTVGGFKWKYK